MTVGRGGEKRTPGGDGAVRSRKGIDGGNKEEGGRRERGLEMISEPEEAVVKGRQQSEHPSNGDRWSGSRDSGLFSGKPHATNRCRDVRGLGRLEIRHLLLQVTHSALSVLDFDARYHSLEKEFLILRHQALVVVL